MIKISKFSEEKREVYGIANMSVDLDGELVTDTHGDQISPDVLEKAAHQFVIRYREGGLEHMRMGVATLIESVFLTQEKLDAMGIDVEYRGAAWFVGFKVHDPDVWAAIKSGDLPAFSIGGKAIVEDSK